MTTRTTIRHLNLAKTKRCGPSFRKIQQQGYATSIEEYREGVSVISVPVFNAEGVVIAVITLCSSTYRFADAIQCRAMLTVLIRIRDKLRSKL